MGAEGNSYITKKCTKANKKRYGDKHCSSRDVKETKSSHCGNEEENDKEPAKKTKSKTVIRNDNAFGCSNNDKAI